MGHCSCFYCGESKADIGTDFIGTSRCTTERWCDEVSTYLSVHLAILAHTNKFLTFHSAGLQATKYYRAREGVL